MRGIEMGSDQAAGSLTGSKSVGSVPALRPTAVGVICCYSDDRWERITAAVRSLQAEHELSDGVCVIVDHNESLEKRLLSTFPGLTVLANRYDPGLSGARNTGIEATTAEVVYFLDDDAVAMPGWAGQLLAMFSDESVDVVGGYVNADWEGGRRPAWFPEEFDWVVGCSYRGLPNRVAPVRNPIGAGMAIRRSALERCGRFSALVGRVGALPVGCEETELCIRVAKSADGARILHVPTAHVRHHVPRSRQTVAYFLRRCFHEGRSKAVVARIAGVNESLSSERSYLVHVIPQGVFRSFVSALKERSIANVYPAVFSLAGVAWTGFGYIEASLANSFRNRPRTDN